MQQQQQPTTVITVPSQPVQYFVSTPAAGPNVYPKFPRKQATAAGTLLIVAAVLSIAANIVELTVNNTYYFWWNLGYIGHGFWVGVLCIIPGGLGISAGKRRTKCLINSFNVMCIIAASFAAAQFAIGLAGAIIVPRCSYYYYNYNYYNYCVNLSINTAMEAVMAGLALVEAAAAIWGSAICCRTICCCSSCEAEPRPVAMVTGTQLMVVSGNPQVQQPVMVQGYSNIAYQPGYPGQPTQFTAMPISCPPQGQFIQSAVQSPPAYINVPQNFQMNVQPMNQQIAGVHTTAPGHPASTEEKK